MFGFGILSGLLILPLIGAAAILVLRGDDPATVNNIRWIAFWTTVATFILSLVAWYDFNPAESGFQLVEQKTWFSSAISYKLGVDGMSMPFVLLTTLLMPISIAASPSVERRVAEYMVAFLVLETLMIGVFVALDLVLFYLFFEGGLIPMFLIIGVWGGKRRVYAAFKFFLYTLLGSVLMLLAIIVIYWQAGTSDLPTAVEKMQLSFQWQFWLWLAFFASFAVKVPMWPVHTWLPDAHVEAPTAGSVILAGVLLKMGGYGFIRFSLPMMPDASGTFAPLIFGLSVVAIIYTSLVALAQDDMKKLIAYSSVAHMGIVTMGIFTVTAEGLQGAMIQMLSHGVVSAALFLCVGVVYDRLHTREIARYGGLVHNMPKYAFCFMVFTLASVGLPGTSGFVGEFLALVGAFEAGQTSRASTWVVFLATTGIILSAAYMLWLYRRIIFEKITREDVRRMADLHWREIAVFVPMIAVVLWMGIYPNSFLKPMQASIARVMERVPAAAGGPVPQHLAQR